MSSEKSHDNDHGYDDIEIRSVIIILYLILSNMNCMINKHIQHYWYIKSHYSRYTTSIIQLLKYYEIDFCVMDSAARKI